MNKPSIFKIAALFYFVTAIYHSLFVFGITPMDSSSVERHAIFVGLTLFMSYGLWISPNFKFTIFFFVMTMQQLWSHGGDLLRQWNESSQIDWVSVPSVLGFPILLFLMIRKLSLFGNGDK